MSEFVFDVTEATFERDAIAASMKHPVLIDLWAEWCGPCKVLGPILDDLADTYGGAFTVAKVDVDANQQLAGYFRAQSIPMVIAIFNGQLVDQFSGALPKQQVEQFIAGVFERVGLELAPLGPPTVEVPSDPAAAQAHFRARLAERSDDMDATLSLGKLLMANGEVDEAEPLLKSIPAAAPQYSEAQAALKLKDLLAEVGAAGGEQAARAKLAETPDDVEAAYIVALATGASGHYADALEALVGQVQTAPAEARERAKRSASVLFEAAGRGDERVETLRRKLARLLF